MSGFERWHSTTQHTARASALSVRRVDLLFSVSNGNCCVVLSVMSTVGRSSVVQSPVWQHKLWSQYSTYTCTHYMSRIYIYTHELHWKLFFYYTKVQVCSNTALRNSSTALIPDPFPVVFTLFLISVVQCKQLHSRGAIHWFIATHRHRNRPEQSRTEQRGTTHTELDQS